VPNKSTVSRLVNRFRDTGSVQDRNRNSSPRCIKHEENSECMRRWTRWTSPTLDKTLFSDFNVTYFLTNRTCVRNGLCDFRSPCTIGHTCPTSLLTTAASSVCRGSRHPNKTSGGRWVQLHKEWHCEFPQLANEGGGQSIQDKTRTQPTSIAMKWNGPES
jgi:hypothetical protein